MGSQIVSIHVGQAGCKIGESCWEMYCLESQIPLDGNVTQDRDIPTTFFTSYKNGKCVPLATFIDLESSCIDEIRKGNFRNVFNPGCLISGKEDAASCFARGYVTLGKEIEYNCLQQIRRLVEETNHLQGFLIFRSYGGGTGSGLVTLLMESLTAEYPKRNQTEFVISPSPNMTSFCTEPYNAVLATHASLEHTSSSFLVDNESACGILQRYLHKNSPSITNINRLLGHVISSVTSSLRYRGGVNLTLDDIQTNLIPHKRIQFPVISYSPFVPPKEALYQSVATSSLLFSTFDSTNMLLKCSDKIGKYISMSVLLRGDVNQSLVYSTLATLKEKKISKFVEWCPTEFKVGIIRRHPFAVPEGDLAVVPETCTVLSCATSVRTVWQNLNRKFDSLMDRKAFLHWYLAEGLEESDFYDARLDLGCLEDDYIQIEKI